MTCTRCQCTGFINLHQAPDGLRDKGIEAVLAWINDPANQPHDVQVCDCCGDGDNWHGEPGEHNPSDFGPTGPYSYNGGLPECN